MVDYLNNFLPFGAGQRLTVDEILDILQFSLPREWQKELIVQRFYFATQVLTELVDFCERLKTSEEIFQTQVELNHQNKNPIIPMNATNLPSWRRSKGQTRP